MINNSRFEPFRARTAPQRTEELPAFVRHQMAELERVLAEWRQLLSFGPVGGAYLPLMIHRPGAVAAAAGIWRIKLGIEARPILLSVGVKAGGGNVTIDLNSDGTSILTAATTTVSGLALLKSRSSFAVEKVASGAVLSLDVDAVSGSPTDLSILIVCKGAGKVET